MISLDSGKAPQFNWRPLEAMQIPGKFLILNMAPNNELSIQTATIPAGWDAKILQDYLKWAIAWDAFPDMTATVIPEAA